MGKGKRLRALIDTDIFVLDLRYPRDPRYSENKAFLGRVKQGELAGSTTLYNLMEVCGILSFNLSPQSLEELFIGFAERFNVAVLFPDHEQEEVCFAPEKILEAMKRKLSFGDALIAEVIQRYRRRLDLFVTWNATHFEGKVPIEVLMLSQLSSV